VDYGDWQLGQRRTHGQQFKARFLKTSVPTSVDGIERYLASGMIRGIGPVYAKKLLNAFGEKVFDVIEAEPDRLREVDGIGPIRASRIIAAWAEQKVVREIMVFLHSHGVGTARAVRIYKTYGADAVQVMSENPYRLARDTRIAWAQAYPTRPVHIIVGFHGDRQGSRYGNGFASQKCGGAKVTIRSLLLCGDRDIDIHRLRDWHGLAIASGPQALKLVKRFVETSLKSGFVTGELTKCIALFRVSIERASKEDFFPVAFTSGAI
jgi:NAD-dependent DNA ligase